MFVPAWHRAYVRSHPLGLAISSGIACAGLIGLILPDLVRESAPSLVLPAWVLIMFNLSWVAGGVLSAIGLLRGRREIEIPGLILLAGGLAAYYIVAVSIRATSALTALFIATMALGCAGRAWHLYRRGYDGQGTL